MKKFINLVKNESLKLWGQTSWRVLTIILAVILLVTPLFSKLFYELINGISFGNSYEDYIEKAEEAREKGEELEAREYETLYEAGKYFDDLGLYESSTEYSLYNGEYCELMLAKSTLQILSEGEFTVDDLNSSYYCSLDNIYYFLTEYGFYDDTDDDGYYQYNVLDIVNLALEERGIEAWITAIDTEITSLRFNIENFSMKFYYEQMLTSADDIIAAIKADSEEKTALLAGNLPEAEKKYYRGYVDYCADALECFEVYRKGIEYLMANSCDYGSWEYNTVVELMYSAATSCDYSYPLTESEFAEGYYSYEYDTVDEYNDAKSKERLLAIEACDYAIYSLENSVPLPKTLADSSTKTMITSQFRSFVGMLTILFICFGGVTMAHEYSSGTIRLLLIKPRSRTRIIGSKFVCLAFWWLLGAIIAVIVLGAENILLWGVGDVFVPDLKAMRSGITEIPALLSLLGVFGEEFLLGMLYVTFALLFAVLTRKASLSILFPVLVSMGASITQTVCIALYEVGMVFVAYTPFFYLDFEILHATAVDRFLYGNDMSDIGNVIGTAISMSATNVMLGKHASILIGIAMIAALVGVFVAISISAFRKQKI